MKFSQNNTTTQIDKS